MEAELKVLRCLTPTLFRDADKTYSTNKSAPTCVHTFRKRDSCTELDSFDHVLPGPSVFDLSHIEDIFEIDCVLIVIQQDRTEKAR